MPENPKDKKDGTWEDDQKNHEYYYDDAHGYEDYDPQDEDSAESEAKGEVRNDRPDDASGDAECCSS